MRSWRTGSEASVWTRRPSDPEGEERYVPTLEACGLTLRLREPGHRYFRPPADRPRDVHVHVCEAGSASERGHLLFHDYLRAHPAARDAYTELKRELAQRYPNDRLAYTDAKSAFIIDAMDAARDWAVRTGRNRLTYVKRQSRGCPAAAAGCAEWMSGKGWKRGCEVEEYGRLVAFDLVVGPGCPC
ncbi:MAG: GrpB family protein [Candidatus Limnocylindria bacterium]